MPTHKEIYESHAAEYEALVSREDYEGNILRALEDILPVEGLDVLDLGTGTGRLARILAPKVRRMWAFDISPHMLAVARDKLRASSISLQWVTAAADHRLLPVASKSTDLIVSGWSVSYVAHWGSESWRRELDAWLDEGRRVLADRGKIVLFESLGTGNRTPQRLGHLENFYDWLDQVGFLKTWIRTDYRFETTQLADELVGFFFGEEMKAKIMREDPVTLPECTGVWWKGF